MGEVGWCREEGVSEVGRCGEEGVWVRWDSVGMRVRVSAGCCMNSKGFFCASFEWAENLVDVSTRMLRSSSG